MKTILTDAEIEALAEMVLERLHAALNEDETTRKDTSNVEIPENRDCMREVPD